ncbi:uncharacterized protein G2W53_013002 [Senna tora]|uniref:Uncharacterized protein n=1 Tax=Senna tora TaxID=362788 RepID=A0A834U479_9FABA|nr:uncharacterized protein G2W53_013002 [Senna tora]
MRNLQIKTSFRVVTPPTSNVGVPS